MDTINIKNQMDEISLKVNGSTSVKELKNHEYGEKYKQYCRPKLAELLGCLNMDKAFHKAYKNYLVYSKETENGPEEVNVLDFVGGYGASILGHNHPELTELLINSIKDKIPFAAQCATRSEASLLGEKLNELVPGKTKYFTHISNSGTEAVEAAIKHAYMVWSDETRRDCIKLMCSVNDFFNNLSEKEITEKFSLSKSDIRMLQKRIEGHNQEQLDEFSRNAVIGAFKGSFHGKTTSSVKVTYNNSFREAFNDMTTFNSIFIDRDQPYDLIKEFDRNVFCLLYPEAEGEKIVIKEKTFSRMFAFILEVILGEGGVIPLSDKTLEVISDIHKKCNIPFIVDEIQTGCGRTGGFFSFADTPVKDISPEYITLSKSLGGGLTKIGATLISEKVYDPEFGLVHTSTFSEDDLSCRISSATINILTRNDNALLKEVTFKGEYIKGKLEILKSKYPDIISDVRGKGLMLGIEFTDLSLYGNFLKYAGTQGFISLLVAGYILEHYNIRLLPPLSTMFKGKPGEKRKSVLRLLPPVYITKEEIDLLIKALDESLNIVDHNNEFLLVAHLINYPVSNLERKMPARIEVASKRKDDKNKNKPASEKLGFIVHITELDYLINHYMNSFNHYNFDRRQLTKWWNKLCKFLEPDLMYQKVLTFKEKSIEVDVMCLPYLPKYMIKVFAEGKDLCNYNRQSELQLFEMQNKIHDAATEVSFLGNKEIPLKVVGLGAYNSIITDNANDFNDLDTPVTTGNAYTAALMYQGLLKAVDQRKSDISKCTAAVVGAGGNIGQAIAELLSLKVNKLILIGRGTPESTYKLEKTKASCFEMMKSMINESIIRGNSKELIGMPEALYVLNNYSALPEKDDIPGQIRKYFDEHVVLSGSLNDLMNVDIAAIATNSSDSWLINPNIVKKGAIVCCASVPSNLSEQFKDCQDEYFVFDSGYAKMPGSNVLDCIGMPQDGMVYGCLGETLLMALNNSQASFAKGKVTSEKILETLELADKFGFELGKFVLGDHIKRMVT